MHLGRRACRRGSACVSACTRKTPRGNLCAYEDFYCARRTVGLLGNPGNYQTPNGEKPRNFVALEQSQLSQTLEQSEDRFLRAVLKQGAGANLSHSVTNAGTGTPTAIKNNKVYLGILGALAREIGHIKWHRDSIYSSLPCYYDKFIEPSWSKPELPTFYKQTWTLLKTW